MQPSLPPVLSHPIPSHSNPSIPIHISVHMQSTLQWVSIREVPSSDAEQYSGKYGYLNWHPDLMADGSPNPPSGLTVLGKTV